MKSSPRFWGLGPPRLWFYLPLLGVLLTLSAHEHWLGQSLTAIVLILVLAFLLSAICRSLPAARAMRLEPIIIVFVPSYLVHIHWIGAGTVAQARWFVDTTDVIGLFITVLITGSVLETERHALFSGLCRMLLPLGIGSVLAAAAGTLAGVAFGVEPLASLFYTVAPIMAGGINAGALPLSIGYATALDISQPDILAQMVPAVILGNFAAIALAGLIDFYYPEPCRTLGSALGSDDQSGRHDGREGSGVDSDSEAYDIAAFVAAGAVLALTYAAGTAVARVSGFPSTLITVLLAAVYQVTNLMPAKLRRGIVGIYRACVSAFTYPILFAVGMLLIPWRQLLDSFTLANTATIVTLVGSLGACGFVLSRWAGLAPADGAVLTLTRAALGGTGDVAILSAAQRMRLMALAQISTRIGGALTVGLTLVSVEHFLS